MTTSPALNNFFYVKMKLLCIADGTKKTIYLSSRPAISDTTTYFFPLLLSMSGLGQVVGKTVPAASQGEISILDTFESFGYERKFSDLLQRYTINDQTIEGYAAQTQLDDTDITADASLIWKAKMRDVQCYYQDDQSSVIISIETVPIAPDVLTKEIETGQFPNAPTRNIGKALPIVVGQNVQVEAIQIAADGNADPEYAYATALGTQFPVGGLQKIYSPNIWSGAMEEIESVSSASTAVFSVGSTSGAFAGANWGSNEIAMEFDYSLATKKPLITKGRIWCKGQNNAGITPTGDLIFRLYINSKETEFDSTAYSHATPTDQPIAEARVSKADYLSQVRGASDFWVDFSFNKPVPIHRRGGYFISVQMTNYSGSSTTDFTSGNNSGGSNYKISRSPSAAWQGTPSGTSPDLRIELFGVKFTDTPSPSSGQVNADGLAHCYVELTQGTAGTNQKNPDLTGLNLVFEVNGLKDDSSGNITGTPSAQITDAAYAIKLLSRSYVGGSWTASSDYDFSVFTDTHSVLRSGSLARTLAGKSNGRATREQIFEQILNNSACRLVLRNNGKLALYAWGTTRVRTSFEFTNENSRIVSYQRPRTATVINRLLMKYGPRLANSVIRGGGTAGEFEPYSGTFDWTNGTDTLATLLLANSQSRYGIRALEENVFDWVNDSTTIKNVGKAIIGEFRTPQNVVVVRAPFFANKARELLDCGYLLFPELPSHFGSTAKASNPVYNGTPITVKNGQYLVRAARYEAQIVGMEFDRSFDEEPSILFTLRILDNFPVDLT